MAQRRRKERQWGVGAGIGTWAVAASMLSPAALAAHSQPGRHPSAIAHQPMFITAPGETDILLVVMVLVLIAAVLGVGVFFFWLHSLPERLVHNSSKVHFDIVAALALLSLFTHIHLFWVLALLLALVRIPMPDFTGLLHRIASSLEKMAGAPAPEGLLVPGSSTTNGSVNIDAANPSASQGA